MGEEAVDRAIAGVADRTPVDWDAIECEAGSAVDRDWLHWVRVLEGVAGLHVPLGGDEPRPDLVATLPPGPIDVADGTSSRWGKYVLLDKVGEGGFGSVYRAWDPDLEIEVAIKILHRRIADATLKRALLQEGRALARIKHQNVVRVLGVESHEDQIALRMEFVHGETLEEILRRYGTLNASEAALVGEDVCRALAAVHVAGFVHRDVKARNVMREQAGRIVLMDFGAGQQAEDLKVPGRIANVGTPLYMAPEVVAGEPATAASDVYSVGVLLYYLVTGQYPVEGKTLEEIRLAHMQGRRRSLSERRPDVPAGFAQVVQRALASDPINRYGNASALTEALESIFGASRETQTRTVGRRAQEAGLAVVGGASVILALGLVNSLEFNYALGRAEFVRDTALDWAWWGLRSSIGPLFTLLLVVFVCSLAMGLHRLAVAASGGIMRVDTAARAYLTHIGRTLRLDDSQLRGSLLLLVSAALLVGAWIYFEPLLGNLLLEGNVSSATAAKLQMLSPVNRPYHYLYRKAFTGVMIFAGAACYLVWRFGPRPRDPFHHVLLAGMSAVFTLALFSLDLPFRILYMAEFDAVAWRGSVCYVLGERADDALLFCPAMEPRNRLVKRIGGGIEYLGRKENIFTQFGAPGGTTGPAAR